MASTGNRRERGNWGGKEFPNARLPWLGNWGLIRSDRQFRESRCGSRSLFRILKWVWDTGNGCICIPLRAMCSYTGQPRLPGGNSRCTVAVSIHATLWRLNEECHRRLDCPRAVNSTRCGSFGSSRGIHRKLKPSANHNIFRLPGSCAGHAPGLPRPILARLAAPCLTALLKL